ncbi:hypothetical protein PT974_04648 [Cladobotryum mycophilum]|uniref:Uncharacterized protein n=1 Tax=Cladobotryum mycophilum TaxID=491253 RepID=A0ABR0SVP4_9HYPO
MKAFTVLSALFLGIMSVQAQTPVPSCDLNKCMDDCDAKGAIAGICKKGECVCFTTPSIPKPTRPPHN